MRFPKLGFVLFSINATVSIALVQRQPVVKTTLLSKNVASPKPSDGYNRLASGLEMSTKTENDAIDDTKYELLSLPARPGRPLQVAIAGGGVGGLTAALCMLKKGFDVTVYEKTAAFARFGGPIQFASNALSVLKEIDDTLFNRVMEKFTFTGTRACGIKDGLRSDGSFRMTVDSLDYLFNPEAPADWFVKFPLKVCEENQLNFPQFFFTSCRSKCSAQSAFLNFFFRNVRTFMDSRTLALLIVLIYKRFCSKNVRKSNPTLFRMEMRSRATLTMEKERV